MCVQLVSLHIWDKQISYTHAYIQPMHMRTGTHVVCMNGMVILYVGLYQIWWHNKSIIGWQESQNVKYTADFIFTVCQLILLIKHSE